MASVEVEAKAGVDVSLTPLTSCSSDGLYSLATQLYKNTLTQSLNRLSKNKRSFKNIYTQKVGDCVRCSAIRLVGSLLY